MVVVLGVLLVVEAGVDDLLVVVLHHVERELDRTIGDVRESRLRNVLESVPSQVVDPLELLICHEVHVVCGEGDQLVVHFQQFVADVVLDDVGVQGSQVDVLAGVVQLLPVLALHELYALDRNREVKVLLQKRTDVEDFHVVQL